MNGKETMIESQNSKNFLLGNKKVTLIKFRTYAEQGKFDEIENIINKFTLKKLGLSAINMAEIYMEYNHFNKRKGELFQILEKLKCTQKNVRAILSKSHCSMSH